MERKDKSYWETAAGVIPRAPSAALPERVDVAIVGAGFAGSWLAYFLKRREPALSIALLERDYFNLGASSRNAGFLSCGNLSEWKEDLEGLGWRETARTLKARIEGVRIIEQELPEVPRQHHGSADFDPITDEKIALKDRMNRFLVEEGHGPFFEIRDARLGRESKRVFFNTFDKQLNPCDLLLALHAKLESAGVPIFRNTRIESIADGRAHLAGGAALRYGHAFLCTNAFARRLNPASHVEPARGQILVTSPCSTGTTRTLGFLESGYDYFRFIGDRVLVGGGRLGFRESEGTDALDTTDGLREYLTRLAARVIGHDDFRVDHHWSGIMGLRAGRHACLTELEQPVSLDSVTEELAGFGGWGVTLTPYLTKRLASLW